MGSEQYEKFDQKVLRSEEQAIVYGGYDHELKRRVAIKELSERLRNQPALLAQFWDEAEAVAELRHENIVEVINVDKQRGWIILEDVEGNLRRRIADSPMPPDEVRTVLKQLLAALEFLQHRKKIHGHIKPENVFVKDGKAKLSDFLALDLQRGMGQPKGNEKYLAPEMINPAFGKWGPAADLYCLGFTALELLIGTDFDALFPQVQAAAAENRGQSWARWHWSPHEALKPAAELVRKLPADLAETIDRLVHKNVAARYPTAREALKRLADAKAVRIGAGRSDAGAAAPAAEKRELRPAYLELTIGNRQWTVSGSKPALVGKYDVCDVRLSGRDISSRHATIALFRRAWIVVDAGSREGTFVNDQRVSISPLRTGDRLRFGDVGGAVKIGFRTVLRVAAAGGARPPDPARRAGVLRRVGDFEILRLFHRGAQTNFFYGLWTKRRNAPVALRVFPIEALDSDQVRRLVRGVKLAAELKHPNIVELHSMRRLAGNRAFLAMEWMPGRSLRDQLRRPEHAGKLPVGRAVRAALDICRALEAAAASGVLHRNVTPDTILFAHSGVAKLGDFSLAKETQSALRELGAGLTQQGGPLLGDCSYAAPEIINDSAGLDARADMYSLACCLYEALAGRPPFPARNIPDLIQRILHGGAEPPSKHAAALPPGVDDVLLRALARQPADRYAGPAEFRAALEALDAAAGPQPYPMD